MNDSYNHGNNRRVHKGIITIIVVLLLTVGGGVTAFVLSNVSAKEAYFLAEKNTMDTFKNFFIDRYKDEYDWNKKSYEQPIEQNMELSAQYNGPTTGGTGYSTIDPIQIINHSSLNFTMQSDLQNKQGTSNISANIAGMEISGFDIYVTDEKLLFGLPFVEEYLQISEEDIGSLLNTIDPITFTGEETLDLDVFFERNGGFTEEDWQYFKEEYFQMIYEQLPEEAFTSESEQLEVNGETIETEKITFHLTEQQVKDILINIVEKMEKDDRFKDLLRDQLLAGQLTNSAIEEEVDFMISEFETALQEVKENINQIHIPKGFTSMIWTDDDLVVSRDIQLEMGAEENDSILLKTKGTQLLNDQSQYFDYTIDLADAETSGTIEFVGDLSWDDNKIEDSIHLTFGEYKLTYEGSETLTNGTREFERIFSYKDSFNQGNLTWEGTSSYEKDSMNSEHNIAFSVPDLGENFLQLDLLVEGAWIDKVEMPIDEEVKDIGKMSKGEFFEFIEYDLTPSMQQWLFGFMAGSAWNK